MSQDPQSKLLSSGLDFTPTLHHDTYDFINPERFDLNGEAVFITGASKGICRAVAMSFAKAGASYIALGARSDLSQTKKEVQEAAQHAGRKAPQILALKLDVANEASVQSAAREVEEAFGRLDILCNNAGALEPWASIAETRVDSWWNVWEVNIRGVYLVTRTLLPLMLRGGMETILNTTSVAAHFSMPGASSYQISKSALLRFGEFIHAEYGEQGILSFGFHPGGVVTDLALGLPEALHYTLEDQPALAGDGAVWLTAERREWLAGRYISVNWDAQELLRKREKIVRDDLLKVRMDVGLE